MSKKLKFKPVISRVKLNPEQAVLLCSIYTCGWELTHQAFAQAWATACNPGQRVHSENFAVYGTVSS